MKANVNESYRFQLKKDRENYRETAPYLLSNRATIVCTYKEQHKLAAQKTFFL